MSGRYYTDEDRIVAAIAGLSIAAILVGLLALLEAIQRRLGWWRSARWPGCWQQRCAG